TTTRRCGEGSGSAWNGGGDWSRRVDRSATAAATEGREVLPVDDHIEEQIGRAEQPGIPEQANGPAQERPPPVEAMLDLPHPPLQRLCGPARQVEDQMLQIVLAPVPLADAPLGFEPRVGGRAGKGREDPERHAEEVGLLAEAQRLLEDVRRVVIEA